MDGNGALGVEPVRTGIFHKDDELVPFILRHLPKEGLEGAVLAVTSKIVSLSEGCVVPVSEISKAELVRREADHFLADIGYGTSLTIKHGLFIPSAGIDESNAEGAYYITFPKEPFGSARRLHADLAARTGARRFGILITDSHTHPLRRGVTGIALSYWGIRGTRKMVGEKDLFGRELKMTYVNVADALAASAVFVMGEAAERCPLALIRASSVEFVTDTDPGEVSIPMEQDLYAPVFRHLLGR